MTARDPRDVAIDALVQTRGQLTRSLEIVNARLAELKDGAKLGDRRKYVCPHAGCGLRFYREDQAADHVQIVHWGTD